MAILQKLRCLDRRQWRVHGYIANAENDIPFSAVRQYDINRSAILQIPNPPNWQFRGPLDRGQLPSVTSTIATVPNEYWRNCVDADGVLAVVPYVPKPQEPKKRADDDQQRRSGSHNNRKRFFEGD